MRTWKTSADVPPEVKTIWAAGRSHAKKVPVSACTCTARDFLVATIRVWMATRCSIGHYDYYDQVTATRTQNEVVALLTRTRAGPLMNYRYYLPVCAGESHCKWSDECIRSVYSRCAFEVNMGNARFARLCTRSGHTTARKLGISAILHGINSTINLVPAMSFCRK